MYKVKYHTPDGIVWRTLRADSPNEAMRIADKRAKVLKGWYVLAVIKDEQLN